MWEKIYLNCKESEHKLFVNGTLDTVWTENASKNAESIAHADSTYYKLAPCIEETLVQTIADDIWDTPHELSEFIRRPQAWLVFRLGFPNGYRPMSNETFASLYKSLVEELNGRVDGNLVLSVE